MPTADPGPLAGWPVTVAGDDPALRHAAWLLTELGADVRPELATDVALALVSDGTPPTGVPTVTTQPLPAAQDWARSGAMWLTGRPTGPPLLSPGAPASAVRGALLVLRGLLLLAGGDDAAEWPDVGLLGERAAIAGLSRRGPMSAGGSYRPVPAADGWVGLSLARDADVELVPALVQSSVSGDPWAAVEQWARTSARDDVVTRAQLLGIAAARVAAPPSYDDEQARHRGGAHPAPYLLTGGGRRQAVRAPVVVDLTSLWAGPLCAHLLGLAGARVIKVESSRRPDGARSGPPAMFDLLNGGHESVALDLATEAGRQALAALVRRADVVLEASRPRALRQLGICAEEVVAAGATWTSITAYGRTGPWANHVGYGDDVAAAAGLVADDDGVPMPCGDALADPLAGVHAAVATAAALLSSRGYLVDVSMRDVAASTLRIDGSAPGDSLPRVTAIPPRARRATRRAAPLGADTAAVLAELELRA